MSKSTAWVGLLITLVFGMPTIPASGATKPNPCIEHPELSICFEGAGGDFTGRGITSTPGAPGRHFGERTKARGLSATYVIQKYAPTCTRNSVRDDGFLCPQAILSCRPTRTGLVQYWRWDITIIRATGQAQGLPVLSDRTYCIGPGTADLPPVAAISGIVASEFDKLVVLKGAANAVPRGTTLVNYETSFYTDAIGFGPQGKELTAQDPLGILGSQVRVWAQPSRYDWYFGDGTSALGAGPGAKGTKDVHHTYKDTGNVAPHVVITWTGTFTVDGGAPIAVFGTAQTTGPGTPLQVKQARAELVNR